MDLFFNTITLLVIAILIVTVFLVYSVATIRRIGVVAYFRAIGQVGKVIASALGSFVVNLVTLLAASTKTSGATEATANAARGGIFNHRTGKFDDGTDPAGWYEKY